MLITKSAKITQDGNNIAAQKSTPTVPDNYNRVNAWTNPQYEKTHSSEWEADDNDNK